MSTLDRMIDRSAVPDTMAKAITFMLAGAALTLVEGFVAVVREAHRPAIALSSFAFSAFGAWIWWLVARTCQRGLAVGRVWASIFFGLSTLGMANTLAGTYHVGAVVAIVVDVLGWLIGLGAIVMLWSRASGDFFQSRRRYPA